MHYRGFLTSIYLQISKLTFPFIFLLHLLQMKPAAIVLGCKKRGRKMRW